MSNFVVAVPLDASLAELIGKKGSANSITFYNRKLDEHVIVALAPTSIEEKFYAVAESMNVADQILLSTANIDRLFGEILVACSLIKKRTIATEDNNINAMANELGIKLEYASKEKLLEAITSIKNESKGESTRVDIDKSFNVRGVGTVVLGIVSKGRVKVHDKLYHSSGKEVLVRSIQSQDIDIEEAEKGTRVGLALKGMEPDEIEKGDLISSAPISKANKIIAKIETSKYAKESIEAGKSYGLVNNFSYANATVSSIGGEVSLALEKGVSIEPGDEFLLIRGTVPRIFAKGVVKSVLA